MARALRSLSLMAALSSCKCQRVARVASVQKYDCEVTIEWKKIKIYFHATRFYV